MNREKLVSILSLALLMSLAANVFAGSHFVRLMADHYWSDKAQDHALRGKLTPTDRAILESAVDANRPKMNQLRNDIMAARENELVATRAEPFNRKLMEAGLSDELNHKRKALLLLQETRKQAGEKMSSEGRAILQQMRRLGFSNGVADTVADVKVSPAAAQ